MTKGKLKELMVWIGLPSPLPEKWNLALLLFHFQD